MRNGLVSLVCVCCLAVPSITRAQTAGEAGPATTTDDGSPQAPATPLVAPASESFWKPFSAIPGDFAHLFSRDTARIFGVASATFMVAHRWDDDGMSLAIRRFKPIGNFRPGNVGGGMYAQLGGAFVIYSIGRAAGADGMANLGSDLFRAQMLTQALVQGMKVTFRRERPDGSNHFSLPSGHTAAAVSTATVLERRYGWKVGVPAYAASAYVAAARMSANKHHLTDVMVGAAVGLAAGRSATIGLSKHRFEVGVAPTSGGAAITFTKKN